MRRPELWAELVELTPAERIELVQDLSGQHRGGFIAATH